jgi:Biopolymer transport protein ExbD/TolR
MAREIAQGDDSALNMTPMIDVCFQLIVFFMLTLRFPSVANRFEAQLPKGEGLRRDPVVLPVHQDVVVKLFRKATDRPAAEHFTRVRVGEHTTVDLPPGPWPLDGRSEGIRLEAEKAPFLAVAGAIRAAWQAQGLDPAVKGQIRTPAPSGALVPHGDVMRVLDAFVEAGLAHVQFEGAALPR